MAGVEIIIPHAGVSPDITMKAINCLRTIQEHSADYRVIWIDNGSPDQGYLPMLCELPHLLVRNRINQGFVKATNQGLHLSTARYVVLMNNDTEAAPGWLPKLREPLEHQSDIGLCGPRTTAPNSWQGKTPAAPTWTILPTNHMLAFFCTMIKREVIEKVGMLDEAYGVGFADDDDYCMRAHRAGFRLALARHLVIKHHHRTTFHEIYGSERVKTMQTVALSMFHEKRRQA